MLIACVLYVNGFAVPFVIPGTAMEEQQDEQHLEIPSGGGAWLILLTDILLCFCLSSGLRRRLIERKLDRRKIDLIF